MDERRKDRRRALAAFALVACLLSAPACTAHRHRIGLGPTGVGEESSRQFYLFFGLLPINEVNVQRMAADLSSYEVVTDYSLVDILLMPLLLPLTMTSRTVTVYR